MNRRVLDKHIPDNIKPRFTYKGTKISKFFSPKDKIQEDHQSNLTYAYTRNREIRETRTKDYIGETNVRYITRKDEHKKQKQSSICKEAINNDYPVTDEDFEIMRSGYNKAIDRKISEALYIKDYRPILNEQKISLNLQLFN